MSGYVEQLPVSATIGSVFLDIHKRAQTFVDRLDELRRASSVPDGNKRLISELNLSMDWHISFTGMDMPLETTVMSVHAGETKHHLVSVASLRSTSLDESYPSHVGAFRSQEREPDYAIRQLGFQGSIEVRLGQLGITDVEIPNEPFGVTTDIPPRQVGELDENATKRLTVVTNCIIGNLDAIALLLEGTPVNEVLEMLGRNL